MSIEGLAILRCKLDAEQTLVLELKRLVEASVNDEGGFKFE